MKKNLFSFLLLLIVTAVLTSQTLQNTHGTLKVHMTDIKNSDGEIIFYLFDKKNGFPDDKAKALRSANSKIINGSSTAIFENLSYGQYAVFCYHDENGDKKLNKTWYGKPKEGVAFSNNVHGGISGPPNFEEAKYDLKSQSDSLIIKMNYF